MNGFRADAGRAADFFRERLFLENIDYHSEALCVLSLILESFDQLDYHYRTLKLFVRAFQPFGVIK